MKDTSVIQAKRYGIFSCSVATLLLEAADRMVQEDVSCLVVIDDEGYLAGIISRTDLLNAYRQNPAWQSEKVDRHMSRDVVTISPQSYLDQAAQLLLENQVHRLVIAQSENDKLRPLGVLSDADLLYHMVRLAEREGEG